MGHPAGLGFSAQVFEDDVADGCGDDGDGEVLDSEDVVEGDGEGLAGAVDTVELAHEQVGIEEEDDERNLDHRTADVGEQAATRGRGVGGRMPGGWDLAVLGHGRGDLRFCESAFSFRRSAISVVRIARLRGGGALASECLRLCGYRFDFIPWHDEIWVESAAVCRD